MSIHWLQIKYIVFFAYKVMQHLQVDFRLTACFVKLQRNIITHICFIFFFGTKATVLLMASDCQNKEMNVIESIQTDTALRSILVIY